MQSSSPSIKLHKNRTPTHHHTKTSKCSQKDRQNGLHMNLKGTKDIKRVRKNAWPSACRSLVHNFMHLHNQPMMLCYTSKMLWLDFGIRICINQLRWNQIGYLLFHYVPQESCSMKIWRGHSFIRTTSDTVVFLLEIETYYSILFIW